jgi:hypothetical protein
MPSRPRPINVVLGRRTLPYTRRRRPRRFVWRYSEDMIFDQPPGELPIATVRPRASRARIKVIAGDLERWFGARWSWFRPRTVPVIVAFVGMLAVIGAGRYLSRLAQQRPDRLAAPLVTDHVAHSRFVEITTTPPAATMTLPATTRLDEPHTWSLHVQEPQTIQLIPITLR